MNKYKCNWPRCGAEFERDVKKASGLGGGKHNGGSDQVKCPGCGNFLKTWDDAI